MKEAAVLRRLTDTHSGNRANVERAVKPRFLGEQGPKPFSYFRADCGVVGRIEIGRISHGPRLHINTRASPIPTRVYMPVIATPRQTSDMTLSDSKWVICLLRTGASRREFVPAQ